MVTLEHSIFIAASPPTVHAYATNASRWHEWHPATRATEPLPDRPLQVGETIVEHIAAGGRRFSATWTVLEAQPPARWRIETDTTQGRARITYTLRSEAGGTRFCRRLECQSRATLLRWLDPLLVPLMLGPQSRRALARLRQRIEAGPAPPSA